MGEVESAYQKAVKGIKESWPTDPGNPWFDYVSKLSQPLQAVYTIVVLENQVFNGGFDQYFSNRYGQFAELTIPHLRRINAPTKAQCVEEALAIVIRDKLPSDVFREKLLDFAIPHLFNEEGLGDEIEAIDDRYVDSEENVGELLTAYLKDVGYGNG